MKIKKMWVENRVIIVLAMIVIICLCVIMGVMLNYFFGPSKTNYGDRLNGIEKIEITDEIKNNYLNKMKDDSNIEEVNIRTSGKIIYINILFNPKTSLIEAQSKSLASLSNFEEKYLKFYDINFIIKANSTNESDGFLIMGAHNVNGNGLIWNNNTEMDSE